MNDSIWDQVLSRIETKINRHSFYTWFKPTVFVSDTKDTVNVRVPNSLFREWLTKHYSGVVAGKNEMPFPTGFPFPQAERKTNNISLYIMAAPMA